MLYIHIPPILYLYLQPNSHTHINTSKKFNLSIIQPGSSLFENSLLFFKVLIKGSSRFKSIWKYCFLSEVIIESSKWCKQNSYLLVKYLIPSLKRTFQRLSNSNLIRVTWAEHRSCDLGSSGTYDGAYNEGS